MIYSVQVGGELVEVEADGFDIEQGRLHFWHDHPRQMRLIVQEDAWETVEAKSMRRQDREQTAVDYVRSLCDNYRARLTDVVAIALDTVPRPPRDPMYSAGEQTVSVEVRVTFVVPPDLAPIGGLGFKEGEKRDARRM
jgi:hypothetical protein